MSLAAVVGFLGTALSLDPFCAVLVQAMLSPGAYLEKQMSPRWSRSFDGYGRALLPG